MANICTWIIYTNVQKHTPLTTIPEMGPAGSSTVIRCEEHKTLGFGITDGMTLLWTGLDGLGDTDGVTGTGGSGVD